MCNQILLVLVETARMAENSLSFLARIGRSRQSLLHGGFVVVGGLVVVYGFFGRISNSIARSKSRSEVDFGLTWLSTVERLNDK